MSDKKNVKRIIGHEIAEVRKDIKQKPQYSDALQAELERLQHILKRIKGGKW